MNRARVLLADDHPLVLARVTSVLEKNFDVVGVARDGEEMVAEALRLAPDVIVADISMPVMTGIEAAHHLRERGCTARLVFLTVESSHSFVEACMAEGALGYVTKTHLKSDLPRAIEAALAGERLIVA